MAEAQRKAQERQQEQMGAIAPHNAMWAYIAAIPLGAWHWAREGVEELIEEHEVGIGILMLAATAGAAILGLWDEAAALVVLYGAAEGTARFVLFFAQPEELTFGFIEVRSACLRRLQTVAEGHQFIHFSNDTVLLTVRG